MRLLIWFVERLVEWALGALILTLAFSLPITQPHGVSYISDALTYYPMSLMFVGAFFFILGGYSITSLIVVSLSRQQPSFHYVIWNVLVFSLTYGVLTYLFFGQGFITENDLPSINSMTLPAATYIPSILVVALCGWFGENIYRRKIKHVSPKSVTVPDLSPQP